MAKDEIRQLLLDAVQEFESCNVIYSTAAFDIDAYNSDAAFRAYYDNARMNDSMSAVQVACIVRTYKDLLVFPDREIQICAIKGNFEVFYDLFNASMERLQSLDGQIRYDNLISAGSDDLLAHYGRAVRNFSVCCYFLSRYVAEVIEYIDFKPEAFSEARRPDARRPVPQWATDVFPEPAPAQPVTKCGGLQPVVQQTLRV